MGRSGGGGSHGGGSSHSSHSSSSHSHSSHSSSRSSYSSSRNRGGSGRSYGGYGGYRSRSGGYTHIGPTYVGGGGRYRRAGCSSALVSILVIVIFAVVMIAVVYNSGNSGGIPKSTVNRERLDAGSFTPDCVVNEIGWVDDEGFSERSLGAGLQKFWDATGVQPYVLLTYMDSETDTADERFDWTDAYYEANIGREDAMLVVYFDDEPDGVWEMVCGNMTGTVLDDEAKDIFWGCLDRYWNDTYNYSVEDAIETGFRTAGERIMTKTTTGMDVVKIIVIIVGIVVLAGVVLIFLKTKRAHDAQRAEEEARILATPLENVGADSDPLVDKYSGGGDSDGKA